MVGHEAAIPWDAVLAAGHEERRLREPGVRRVIEPLLSGGDAKYTPRDFEYVRDLGLVAPDAPLRIANPVYAELLPRELTWVREPRSRWPRAPGTGRRASGPGSYGTSWLCGPWRLGSLRSPIRGRMLGKSRNYTGIRSWKEERDDEV